MFSVCYQLTDEMHLIAAHFTPIFVSHLSAGTTSPIDFFRYKYTPKPSRCGESNLFDKFHSVEKQRPEVKREREKNYFIAFPEFSWSQVK